MGHGVGGVGVENWVPQVVQMGRSRGSIVVVSLVMTIIIVVIWLQLFDNVEIQNRNTHQMGDIHCLNVWKNISCSPH